MNSRRLIFGMTLPLLITLGACSHGPKPDAQPDWILGQSSQYPASRFLSGRGQADTAAVARDRARADLAKVFSVHVNEQSKDVASYSQGGGDAPAKNSLDVSRNVTTRTNEVLRGVEIADTWQDPATQVYYTLAVLPRAKAAASLRTQIAGLDAGTRAYLARARDSNDLLTKISAATHAVAAQTERAGLQRELQVVDITGRGSPAEWSLGKLRADKAALLARLKITAAAEGDNAPALRKLLAGALADAGFTVGAAADYTMTARLDAAKLPPRDGWYWITGTLRVTLDGATRAHGVQRWKLKASGTDPALAEQRLMDQVARTLDHNVQAAVLHFAGGNKATR